MQWFNKQCYVKSSEYCKRKLSYECFPQKIDINFLLDLDEACQAKEAEI